MRKWTVLFALFPLCVSGQYNYREDTACYSSQFIAVPNDSVHSAIFDTTASKDLFSVIYTLNRKHLLEIDRTDDILMSCCVYEDDINYSLHKDSTQHLFYDLEMNWDVRAYQFIHYAGHDNPLIDWETGEEYIEEVDTVLIAFPYLKELIVHESLDDLDEYGYQKEEYDYEGYLVEYKPVVYELSISAVEYGDPVTLFRVNYSTLLYAMKKAGMNPNDYPWFEMLDKKGYKGFRYKQVPCDNRVNRE